MRVLLYTFAAIGAAVVGFYVVALVATARRQWLVLGAHKRELRELRARRERYDPQSLRDLEGHR